MLEFGGIINDSPLYHFKILIINMPIFPITFSIPEEKIINVIIFPEAGELNEFSNKQIFALFNRRSEIFPKQGITCDDSFFAFC